jgi:hypothetical protein
MTSTDDPLAWMDAGTDGWSGSVHPEHRRGN